MPKHPATIADFPDGSDERINAAIAVAGTTDPIDTHIKDWGDVDGDHTPDVHNSANGIASSRDSDGVGYPSRSETETYLDSLQPEDIKLKGN